MYHGECRATTLGMELAEKKRWLRNQWKDLVTGDSAAPVEEVPDRL